VSRRDQIVMSGEEAAAFLSAGRRADVTTEVTWDHGKLGGAY
jgi:hypothetical protein